jgi:hypothetical protein
MFNLLVILRFAIPPLRAWITCFGAGNYFRRGGASLGHGTNDAQKPWVLLPVLFHRTRLSLSGLDMEGQPTIPF